VVSLEQSARDQLAQLTQAVRDGRYDAAIGGLKKFLEVHREHEVATGLLAAAYFEIGMVAEARALYERLLEAHPGNPLARLQLGLACLGTDARRALEVWQPLLEVEEEFLAHFHAALAHLQLGDRSAARALLEHAAKYMPAEHPLRPQLDQLRSTPRYGR
jgi:tetratricopeptide (TPR) repeat protein